MMAKSKGSSKAGKTKASKRKKETTKETKYEGEAKNLLESMFNAITDGISVIDRDFKIVEINRGLAHYYGHKDPRDLIGRKCHEIFLNRKKRCSKCWVEKVFKTGKSQHSLVTRKDTHGNDMFLEIFSYPIYNEKGEVTEAVEYTRNITKEKVLEEEVRKSEKRFHTLFEKSPASITLLDKFGNIIDCNKSTEKLIGYSKHEIIDKHFDKLLTLNKRDLPKMKENYMRLSKGLAVKPYELEIIRNNGEKRWINVTSSVIKKEEEVVGFQVISIDITERKQAEEALRESEEKYSNLFQKSNDAIIIHDLEGNLIDVNQRVLDFFGYSKKEILGLKISELHPPEELKKSKRAFKTISKKGFVSFEVTFKDKSGEIFPAEVSSSLFEIEGKKVIQGIVRDITERRKAEEKLRESEELYRMLLEQSGDIIAYFNTDGILIAMNQIGARGLEGIPTDFIGKHLRDMFSLDIANVSLRRIQQVVKSGQSEEHEDLVELPAGKGWFRSNYYPMKDASGKIIGVQIVSHDITRRKQAEEKIRELKEFNESIVQSMDEGIMILDEGGYISFINPKIEKMLGYSEAELVGDQWEDILAPDYHRRMRDSYAENLRGESDRFEAVLFKKNRTELPVLISASPQVEDGTFKGVLAVVTDISDRRREDIAREELMRYKIKRGLTYLIKEKGLEIGKEVVYELYKNHFDGLIITREHPEKMKKDINIKLPLYWMTNDPKDKASVRPDFSLLEKIIEDNIDRNTFVLLDRFDYLVTQNSFKEALNFVQHLNEMFYARKAILIISFDPETLTAQELSLLEKETMELEKKREVGLSADLLDLLKFVDRLNKVGESPSYKDVGDEFRITRTTSRKRIKELIDKGLLLERKSGRFKYLVLTESGKYSL